MSKEFIFELDYALYNEETGEAVFKPKVVCELVRCGECKYFIEPSFECNLSVPMTPGSKSQVRRLLVLLLKSVQLIFPERIKFWRQPAHRFQSHHWRAVKLHRLTCCLPAR